MDQHTRSTLDMATSDDTSSKSTGRAGRGQHHEGLGFSPSRFQLRATGQHDATTPAFCPAGTCHVSITMGLCDEH
jgi:hypothetical protein